ncbi:hypothetical protein [Sandaracinus amylolyticus]|uniref:DUF7932 domain-containing protein n=1 Tax=Sandaracinus amylolyticus TaxID=927083 RepID=UPI001F2D562B|nr:hypothetical protein [Sandaracinus amylolyticus]UJR85420.1 Hypothetical protein I5071_75000 [Sandaracinus amylolyticus]
MVYRESPSTIERREPEGDVLLRVDASGRPGAAGARGYDGSDGSGAGGDGSPGGHAGAASPGESGGFVGIAMRSEGATMVRVEGTRRFAEGRAHDVREIVTIGDYGFVDVIARGGAGGHGGDGGRGGDGATGRRGHDATRYSSGGNGGRGGDGGRGGRASSGASGGAGGRVVVQVDDADTHLLMLIRRGIEGGAGGQPGRHGEGGSGGAGGAGGSSHSWTETEHYTDSQGKPQTRMRFHSNPGGSRGPSGDAGASGSGPLYAGHDGAIGAFSIEVHTLAGPKQYPGRYELMLSGITLRTDDRDGVFEPGELVRVDGIRVRNVGAMPSPSSRAITLEVRDSKWCGALANEVLEVPRSVPAGAEVDVPGTLTFELRDHAPSDPADPLAEHERVSLRAHVVDVNRSFERFEPDAMASPATMLVRFPIAASVVEGLVALAPGEVTRLRFAIRNQSKLALGANSPSRRRIRARLSLFESELGDDAALLIDEHGAPVPMRGEGLVRELDLLEAGADWIFEGALGMRESAPSYRELRLRLTLEIGRLDMPDVLRVVQHRELRVRCVRTLAPDARMDWLLVAHHRTSREEIDAWEALAARHERSLAVWDLSREGHLELGSSVIERLNGGLVIVLGHPMSSAGREVRAAEMLSHATMAQLAEAGADLLLAGGSADLRALLAPAAIDRDVAPADGEDALIERLASRVESEGALVETAELHEIGMFFESARKERLEARARALAERLATRFPQRRFTIVWELAPAPRGSWLLVHRYRLGRIRVLARPAARCGVAHVALADHALADPRTIASNECATAIAVASGPDDQIDALARAIEVGDAARARVWSDAILVGLASEQLAVLRRTRSRAGLSRAQMREALPRLLRLAHTPLVPGDREDAITIVAELAAKLRFFADTQVRLWERIPGISWARRAASLDALTEALIGEMIDAQSSDELVRRALRDRTREIEKTLRQRWKDARTTDISARDRGAWARTTVLAPVEREGVTTDDELLVADDGDLVQLDAWNARLRAAHASDQARSALVASAERERSELLLMVRTTELIGPRARVELADVDEHHESESGAVLRASG